MNGCLRAWVFAMILTVPAYDGEWPTLGFQVVAWMQENLVHGPGDIRGEPLRIDEETIGFMLRMYELYPQGHEMAGRRRLDRCGLSVPKGSAKTELGALVGAAELHPEAPVRFNGFTEGGELLRGRGLNDPFIPMVAYTEEQSDELAFGALRVILQNSRVAGDFDIGLERIVRRDGSGKAVSLASSPGARDGARTTFQLFDETHRFTSPVLRKAHETMLANVPKRSVLSDPWTLELSTAYDPAERSVAQRTMNWARAVHDGRVKSTRLFFFHRQASEDHDLSTVEGRKAAVLEARGPYKSAWSDVGRIVGQWDEPDSDKDYLARVWLNQIRHSSSRAFDAQAWARRAAPEHKVPDGALITIGFDGATVEDSTAAVGTEVRTGYQFKLGLWEKPFGVDGEGWRVPEARVDECITDAFERYEVFRMYADPFYWSTWIDEWAGRYGDDKVVRWPTNRWRKTADMIRAYSNAMLDKPPADPVAPVEEGDDDIEERDVAEVEEPKADPLAVQRLSHDGDPDIARHIANAHKMTLGMKDKFGAPLWVIQKANKMSPDKIDAAMAGALSWEARRDAITLGVHRPKPKPRLTFFGASA